MQRPTHLASRARPAATQAAPPSRRHGTLATGAALVALVWFMAGCGGDKAAGPAPSDTAQTDTAPADTAQPGSDAQAGDGQGQDALAQDGAGHVLADGAGLDAAASDVAMQDATGPDGASPDAAPKDGAAGPDAAIGPDAGADTGPIDPCVGQTCSGHGTCFSLYDVAVCTCDPGHYPVGTTECWPESKASPCFPNPCTAPDQAVCTVDASGATPKAVCGCNVGFADVDGLCVFATCPKISAHTGITLYDQTGGSVKGGFDPLQPNDIVKVRVDVRVASGSASVTLELHPDNAELQLARLAFDGKPLTTYKKKGPLLEIPLQLTPGDHSVELLAKLVSGFAPMSVNARLTAPGACELPESRSGARIGPLGLLDAKGFGCVNLDRNRSVQVTAEVVEKSTSVYGQKNGTNSNYSPAGKIVSTVTQCFVRQSDRVLFLAGDALGELPWGVDNYFVVEVFDHAPAKNEKPKQAMVLQADGSVAALGGIQKVPGPNGDIRGTHIGVPNGNPFGWSAGHVRVTDLVPKGQQTWLRFYALDHGVVGRLTRVYIHSRRAKEAPPECVHNKGCAHLGKGCVNGACVGGSCSGSCGGQPGIFCVGGSCSSQCNAGGGSCPSGQVCALQKCVPAGTPGVCDPAQKDADCPLGSTCHRGLCVKGCHHPRQQDQSYKLNNDFCKTGGFCPHCPKPEHGCWNNVCAQCEIDPHCPSGKVCVDRACVTWP